LPPGASVVAFDATNVAFDATRVTSILRHVRSRNLLSCSPKAMFGSPGFSPLHADIANDRLCGFGNFDPLNADDLGASVAEPASPRPGLQTPQESCAGRCHDSHVAGATVGPTGPAQDRHCDCMRAGHLDRRCRLHLVLGLRRLDECQSARKIGSDSLLMQFEGCLAL
jgi:hypothetical protein